MAITFKRYVKSRELVTIFKIEHRLSAYEFMNILGQYASTYMNETDEEELPPPLSQASSEKYIRRELHARGYDSTWTWRDQDEHYVLRCLEWARAEATRLCPHLADDFAKVTM